jgi:hypothetical protein
MPLCSDEGDRRQRICPGQMRRIVAGGSRAGCFLAPAPHRNTGWRRPLSIELLSIVNASGTSGLDRPNWLGMSALCQS